MITVSEKKLLKDLYLQRISFDDLCKESSLCKNKNLLEVSLLQEDGELLEYLLVYYYHFGFDRSLCHSLQELMIVDWHHQHPEIARIMQFKLHCPDSIDYLVKSIEMQHAYLFEQDDYYPFVRKCVNAIRSVGGEKAKAALEVLKEKTNDQEIKRLAMDQLAKM